MNTFYLKITSPDGVLFGGEVTQFSVRSTEGDMAVLAGHAPLVCTVKPCVCKIVSDDGDTEKTGRTAGGLLEVSAEETVLFTGSFEWE